MNKKIIISAALSGSTAAKSLSPHIPISAWEITDDAVAAARAGASIIHVHVQKGDNQPTMETSYFAEAVAALRKAREDSEVDFLINLTTSGGGIPKD